MRRSFIITGLAILGLLIPVGCNGTMESLFSGRGFKPLSEPVDTAAVPASQPAKAHAASPGAKGNAENGEAAGPDDPSVAKMNAAVESFVARFPPAGLGPDTPKDATGASKASDAPQNRPAVAQASATAVHPPVSIDAPAVAVNQEKSHTAALAAELAGAASEHKANAAVNLDRVASPQPMKPADPTPTAGVPQIEIVDVRPAADPPPSAKAPASANQPTNPSPAPQAGDVTRMITQLEEAVKQHPQQMDDQFKLRLLYLATGQNERATAPFTGVDPVQAELMTALFKTMAGAQDALREPSKGSAAALGAATDLRRLLAEQSPVVIKKMALVTAVNSFGDYKAVNPPLFPAGRPVHVFCYCEIANFHSEPTQDGRLRTILAASLEVFDPTGKIIWQQKIPQIEDLVYTPRQDFFAPLEVKLPATLAPGEYVLKVGVEDKLGATMDQQRMTFTIGK